VANESSARIVALPVLFPHFAGLTSAYRSPLHDEIGPSIKLTRLKFQSRQPLLENIEVRIVGIAFVTPSVRRTVAVHTRRRNLTNLEAMTVNTRAVKDRRTKAVITRTARLAITIGIGNTEPRSRHKYLAVVMSSVNR
jgi:hypothetical protein